MNYTNLINTENYVEELCLDYVPQLNTSFMFIILLNIIYFLFLNVLISKIEHKRINSYISNITITILLCANSYLLCYYFIFNHNNIIFDNLELIKKIINIFIIITIVYITYRYKHFIKPIIKELKNLKEE